MWQVRRGSTSFERVLAARGHDGYRQYRIPALAVSPRGTLIAAYDGRPNLDDLPNPIDLLLRRSFDGGRTWQPQQVVRTGVGLEGFGDPSLLVGNETGRIFMFHAREGRLLRVGRRGRAGGRGAARRSVVDRASVRRRMSRTFRATH